MKFLLRELSGFIPDLEYGPVGDELNCFIPSEYAWEQMNYGQGEGQVCISGCEWGFYYADDAAISIVLHQGRLELAAAITFVENVKKKIYGGRSSSVEISLVGTDVA